MLWLNGADLPEGLRTPALAQSHIVTVGETSGFQWAPQRPGIFWLELRRSGDGEFMGQARLQVLP